MAVIELLAMLEASAPAAALRNGAWLYPVVNTAHVMGVALLFGAIIAFDLRLAGLAQDLPVGALAAHLLPLAWTGFALAALSGAALFATEATGYAANPVFLVKLGLIVAAGLNALLLHRWLRRQGFRNSRPDGPPARVRWAGLISILLWAAVIAAGRFIAYW